MATRVLSRITRCLAKVEGTYNTDPATAPATDAVLMLDAGSMTTPVFNFAPTTAVKDRTLTVQHKDILTSAMVNVRINGILQGSGTLGSRTPASFAGQDAIFRAAGIKSTATPSTGPIAYTEQSMSSLESVWLDCEHDGYTQEVGGCVGNLVISAAAQSRVTYSFTGSGHYRALAAGNLGSSISLTDRSEVFNGYTGGIKPSDGSTYDKAGGLVLDGFEFNRGVQIQMERDAGGTYGIGSFFIPDARPTLRVTIAADTASANLDITDIPPDITGRTDHGVEFLYGTNPNAMRFAFPTAQLLNWTTGNVNGYQVLNLEYLISHSTAESAFTIDVGDPSLDIAT